MGPDKLPDELLLNHDPNALGEFHRMIKLVWHQRKVPQRLRDAVIKRLHKLEDKTEYDRAISLAAHAGKVLVNILATRFSA